MNQIPSVICTVVFDVLFRSLAYLNRRDSRIRAGFAAYEDGTVFRIRAGMESEVPCLSFSVLHGRLVRQASDVPADLEITFKSIPDAFLVLTGQLGIGAAYAGHRFFMRGNPNEAMGLVSCMEIAESYLFPHFLSKRLMTEVPPKEISSLAVYTGLITVFTERRSYAS